jgi:choline dehydrogenase-like flavoprotein
MTDIDILIIGSGASGAAAAWNLSNSGLTIMCLEQGGFTNTEEYPTTKINWELERFKKFNPNPNIRNSNYDYPINDSDSPISIANFNAVGGSTILYSGHFPRFHPSDFRVNQLDGVAFDWPLTYEDLEPYYKINDRMMGVSGLSGDPAYPEMDFEYQHIPIGKIGEKIGEGFNKLGWHWWPAYSAIITKDRGSRGGCINLGPCNMGCPQGAKSSVDITYWPLALKNHVILKTESTVKEIVLNNESKIIGVNYFDKDKQLNFQGAKIVILAASGVGTPRILLNSKSLNYPNGLANSSGLVGKNLMLHPLGYVEGEFDEEIESHLGPHGCCVLSQEFYETDPKRGFYRGYTMQVLRTPGALETANSLLFKDRKFIGAEHHNKFRSKFGKTIGISIITEDLPEETNYISIDEKLIDNYGIPCPKINYKLSENTKKMLVHGLEKGRQVLVASGAKNVLQFGPVKNAGWHIMGTAKMGIDSRTSVVNQYGQSHDHKNLFIIDSSIFVTSGAVNPASTIQALSLYISDYIKYNFNQIVK